VTACVNPDHLFLGSNNDNIKDSMQKGRRKGRTRNRPTGLKYNWTKESKEKWLANRPRKVSFVDRLSILEAYYCGVATQRGLAEKYYISQATINRIVNDKYPVIRGF